MRESLANALDTITNTIAKAQGALHNIRLYKESRRQYYSDGLSYKDIKALKITKDQLFSLFRDPSTVFGSTHQLSTHFHRLVHGTKYKGQLDGSLVYGLR